MGAGWYGLAAVRPRGGIALRAERTARILKSRRREQAVRGRGGQFGSIQGGRVDAGKVEGMRKAAFVVENAGRTAEITVIDIPVAGRSGDVLANINRSRGQVGLKPLTQEELDQTAASSTWMAWRATMVELIGPKGDEGRQAAILGVMAVRDGTAWFIKLQGDAELAAREVEVRAVREVVENQNAVTPPLPIREDSRHSRAIFQA